MKLAPSIYTADFARLGEQVQAAERAGVDVIHLDVMDGRFVPSLTFGPAVCAAVKRCTSLLCEAHLMIEQPERHLADYQRAGMSRLIVHAEACPHLYSTLQAIHDLGMGAGLALNPLTPLSVIEDALPFLDLILIMSVEPGFGGQPFIPGALARIARVRGMLEDVDSPAELEVDGGVNAATIRDVRNAGASIVVVGSAVFSEKHSIDEGVRALRAASL